MNAKGWSILLILSSLFSIWLGYILELTHHSKLLNFSYVLSIAVILVAILTKTIMVVEEEEE